MARANQPDRDLRNEVQSQIDDLNDDSALGYDSGIEAQGQAQSGTAGAGTAQGGGAQGAGARTAMRTKATPKTSMQNKKGNQASNR